MEISGNKQRICIGGWYLLALALLGLNASRFMAMEQQSLVGYPQTVKELQTKLQDFDTTAAAGIFAVQDRLNLIEEGTWFSDPPESADNPGAGKTGNSTQIPDPTQSILPNLSGIIQVMDPREGLSLRAVLNGRICRVRDIIDGFTVVKISPTAVVVGRVGNNWTLDGPKPYFSRDQGN
jgi:hypothetical protein